MKLRPPRAVITALLLAFTATWPPAWAAAPATALAKAKFAPQDVAVDRLTSSVNMTKENEAPTRGFTGPTSMHDPDDPRVIVAATADLRTPLVLPARVS